LAASEAARPAADDLQLMLDAAAEAGRIAMRYFRNANEVWLKGGRSPVSQADLDVDDFLKRELLAARPDYGWLSEETADSSDRLSRDLVFVVDPIDGTRGFLEGNAQWCISVALVRAGRPVAGVLHCPALERTFAASSGAGATLNGLPVIPSGSAAIARVTGSKRLNAELDRLYLGRFTILPYIPSLAYRVALVATGEIDAAFASGGSHDWDVAAADIILSEASGAVVTAEGEPLRYNQQSTGNPALVACGPGREAELLHLAKTGRFLH